MSLSMWIILVSPVAIQLTYGRVHYRVLSRYGGFKAFGK